MDFQFFQPFMNFYFFQPFSLGFSESFAVILQLLVQLKPLNLHFLQPFQFYIEGLSRLSNVSLWSAETSKYRCLAFQLDSSGNSFV